MDWKKLRCSIGSRVRHAIFKTAVGCVQIRRMLVGSIDETPDLMNTSHVLTCSAMMMIFVVIT